MNSFTRALTLSLCAAALAGTASAVTPSTNQDPSIKILWDLSKGWGHRERPLDFGSEDGYADVLLRYIDKIRELFPTDRDNYPADGELLVATSPQEFADIQGAGYFPDISLRIKQSDVWPSSVPSYIHQSAAGVLSELSSTNSYDALMIHTPTAQRAYSQEEANHIFSWVKNGGTLILSTDNIYTPRASLDPILRKFGVTTTMQLIADTDIISNELSPVLLDGVNSIHTRAGSALCVGTSKGWLLNYDESRRVELYADEYERRFNDYRANYANIPPEDACKESNPPAGVTIKVLGSSRTDQTGKVANAPVIIEARVGKGRALLLGDSSWFDNSMVIWADGNGRDNVTFINNLIDYIRESKEAAKNSL